MVVAEFYAGETVGGFGFCLRGFDDLPPLQGFFKLLSQASKLGVTGLCSFALEARDFRQTAFLAS